MNTSHRRPAASGPNAFPALLVAVFLLAACTKSVQLKVESDVPSPVVSRIPISAGLFYDDKLRNHAYLEDTEDRPDWKIESGESQVALFDQILPSLFANSTHVDAVAAPGVDAVIAPEVAEMQFALPNETKTDIYEAWIKYTMRLYDGSGKLVAEWPVTGYGKSTDEMMQRKGAGLQAAVNLALRDAGAKLVLGFEQVQDVRNWLAEKTRDCQRYAEYCKS